MHCEQIDVLDEPGHIGQTVRRGDGEARPDDARLDLGVEQHGDQGVLEAGDDDQLVDEGIFGSAQPADLLAQGVRLRRGDVIDHQDLERRSFGGLLMAGQLTPDRVGQSHRRLVVARVAQRADLLQSATTGVGPVGLQWVQQQHQLGDPGLQPRTQIGGCQGVR